MNKIIIITLLCFFLGICSSYAEVEQVIIDELSPFIDTTIIPVDGSKFEETAIPKIGVEFKDSNNKSIKIFLDNNEMTSEARINSNSIFYIPKKIMQEGRHDVRVEIDKYSKEWSFETSSPPAFKNRSPMYMITPEKTTPKVGMTFTDLASGINTDSVKLIINGENYSSKSVISSNAIEYNFTEPKIPGRYYIELSVSDNIGNTKTEKWNFSIPKGKPVVTYLLPEYENIVGDYITFSAEFNDENSDIVQKIVSLLIDTKDVTKDMSITYSSKRKGKVFYKSKTPLSFGHHSATLMLINTSGGSSSKSFEFIARKPAKYLAQVISPKNNIIVTDEEIEVKVQHGSNRSRTKSATISGMKARWGHRVVDEQIRSVLSKEIKLTVGKNIIQIKVEYEDGHVEKNEVTVVYKPR